MSEVIVYGVLIVLAVVAAFGAVLGFAGTVHLASRRPDGYFHYAIYAVLLSSAVAILFSNRSLAQSGVSAPDLVDAVRSPIAIWVQRAASIFLLFTAGERILRRFAGPATGNGRFPVGLLATFVLYWFCTVATTSLWGAYPQLSHHYVYTLVIGSAAILMGTAESQLAIRASRNAILVLILASFLLLPLAPRLLIDLSYLQGFLPGLPRLAGLTPHALTMGLLAQVVLLLLWACPLDKTWLNRLALAMAGVAFFLAQSKTAWISFTLAAVCMLLVRHGASIKRRFNDPRRPAFGVAIVVLAMALILAASAALLFGDIGEKVSRFLLSEEGTQLTTLTGRDQIWRVALDEWGRHPVLGYGPGLFDEAYRMSIRMTNATNAHNQLVDTLARSGVVGAAALVAYLLVLLALSARHAARSGGLTLALFAIIALRSISEVPLSLFSYGPEFVLHLLLLVALAGARKTQVSAAATKPQTPLARSPAVPLFRSSPR